MEMIEKGGVWPPHREAPESAEAAQTPEALLAAQGGFEAELTNDVLNTRFTLAEAAQSVEGHEEDFMKLRKELDALMNDAREALRKVGAAAALATALGAMPMAEANAAAPTPAVESFVQNPELATRVLEGAVLVGPRLEEAEHAAAEAKTLLTEVAPKRSGGKLALHIAEKVGKIALELSGFGVGVYAYDIIKECATAFKESRA